jgi:hypothetical protein
MKSCQPAVARWAPVPTPAWGPSHSGPILSMETAKPGAAVPVFVHGTFSTTYKSGSANHRTRHPQLVASRS